jgi:hypothetical protein
VVELGRRTEQQLDAFELLDPANEEQDRGIGLEVEEPAGRSALTRREESQINSTGDDFDFAPAGRVQLLHLARIDLRERNNAVCLGDCAALNVEPDLLLALSIVASDPILRAGQRVELGH